MRTQLILGLVMTVVVGLAPLDETGITTNGAEAQGTAPPPEQQIEQALSPLPEAMREGVAVRGYTDTGDLVTLREGTSHIACLADDPAVRAIPSPATTLR